MPLDPLSALSVAASAVQFVDFASKIVSKAKNIHGSPEGALRENRETETVTICLQEMADQLENSDLSSTAQGLDDNEQRLRDICNEYSQITEQLVKRLGDLKVLRETNNRKWKSFRQALKSVWSKRDVDDMATRLDELRSELDTHIFVSLR
jgi:flagellar motility protein MotE (MotC chaperone)